MEIIFRDEIGCCTAEVDDSIDFVDSYENGTFVRYAYFYVDGEVHKVKPEDILFIDPKR